MFYGLVSSLELCVLCSQLSNCPISLSNLKYFNFTIISYFFINFKPSKLNFPLDMIGKDKLLDISLVKFLKIINR